MPSKMTALRLLLCGREGEVALHRLMAAEEKEDRLLEPLEFLQKLEKDRGCQAGLADAFASREGSAEAAAVRMTKAGIGMIMPGQMGWPSRLQRRSGHAALFVKGNVQLLSKPTLGFAGGCSGSRTARMVAEHCGLSRRAVLVAGFGSEGMECLAAAIARGGSGIIVSVEGLMHMPELALNMKTALRENRLCLVSTVPPMSSAIQGWVGEDVRDRLLLQLSDALAVPRAPWTLPSFFAGSAEQGSPEELERRRYLCMKNSSAFRIAWSALTGERRISVFTEAFRMSFSAPPGADGCSALLDAGAIAISQNEPEAPARMAVVAAAPRLGNEIREAEEGPALKPGF